MASTRPLDAAPGHAEVLFPRAFLYRWLARCKSSALPPDVCSFAEARFGAGFGDVRIRTGPAADGLCAVLGVRACTLGSSLMTRETVLSDTCARAATSLIVDLRNGASGGCFRRTAASADAAGWLA